MNFIDVLINAEVVAELLDVLKENDEDVSANCMASLEEEYGELFPGRVVVTILDEYWCIALEIEGGSELIVLLDS